MLHRAEIPKVHRIISSENLLLVTFIDGNTNSKQALIRMEEEIILTRKQMINNIHSFVEIQGVNKKEYYQIVNLLEVREK